MFMKDLAKLYLVFTASLLLIVGGCSTPSRYITIDDTALGTFVQVKCETTLSPEEITLIIREVDAEAKASMSIFDPTSLLSQLNRNEAESVDKHIAYNIALAERFSSLSNGAYDITIKPLTDAWGFGRERSHNRQVNVDSILSFVGYDKLRIDGDKLIKHDPRVQIDLNSIAKGYVVDMAACELERLGMENYLVDIGGEVRCKGVNSKGGAWRVGIETPFDGNNNVGAHVQQVISLTDCAMATSGNYRRYYLDAEGRKVAHTIDPHTGKSVITNLLSATVIAPTCAEADAYGTMFMAMGLERAIEVARELESSGVMVYFIAAGEGEEFEIYYSKKLAPALKTTEGYRVIE
jgi:thiamine biosynthesis lipoprotein